MGIWEMDGPQGDVAVTSRVRIARNYADYAFPAALDQARKEQIAAQTGELLSGRQGFTWLRLGELDELQLRQLGENYLASPALIQNAKVAALALNEERTTGVMVNEEDHLRIQSLAAGLDLERALAQAQQLCGDLEAQKPYAFSARWGYLTSCPTNIGTGLRASVMMHLSALTMMGKINTIIEAVGKIGLTVRGSYGEGSAVSADLYQISNQVTMGLKEKEIAASVQNACMQVMAQERLARKAMMAARPLELQDRLMRAWGAMQNARMMDLKEFMRLYSDVRLAESCGYVQIHDQQAFRALLCDAQPASLQLRSGRRMSARDQNIARAELVRKCLAQ